MDEEAVQRINRQCENIEIYKEPMETAILKFFDILTESEKRVADILSDPDWRVWLEKAGTYRDEYYTTVKWGKPPEGMMCQVKEESA